MKLVVIDGRKKCNACKVVKPVEEFTVLRRSKNGYNTVCKICSRARATKYLNDGYREIKNQNVKIKYAENKDLFIGRVKAYYEKNKEQKSSYNKAYGIKNKEIRRSYRNEYEKNRTKTDLEYRALKNFRKLIYHLKIKKIDATEKMLGYSYQSLIAHLGRIPQPNEAIDHKIPISWFNSMELVVEINHLDNLQILTKSENSKKSNCFSHPVSKAYYNLIMPHIKEEYKNKINFYGNSNSH